MTAKTISSSDPLASLDLVEIKPGLKFSRNILHSMLPDAETTLFFGKVYDLNAYQLSDLLLTVIKTDLVNALLNEGHAHSNELQHYLVGIIDEGEDSGLLNRDVTAGAITFQATAPKGELLPQVWASLEVEVAQSIKTVAEKLATAVGRMPGKQGSMIMQHMLKLNAQRPTLGVYRAGIHHAPLADNLVILDVSGSMSESTVRRIVDDVVALSYKANAHMAIVSSTTTHWEPGSYDTASILQAAEYGGTCYETLKPLLDRDWGTVVTVADYDSSPAAKTVCATARGSIQKVLDLSLVNQPTYLAACVGQLAKEVQPLLIGNSHYVLD